MYCGGIKTKGDDTAQAGKFLGSNKNEGGVQRMPPRFISERVSLYYYVCQGRESGRELAAPCTTKL